MLIPIRFLTVTKHRTLDSIVDLNKLSRSRSHNINSSLSWSRGRINAGVITISSFSRGRRYNNCQIYSVSRSRESV